MHRWFTPQETTSNDVLATYSITLTEYISLEKYLKSGRKFGFNFFLDLFQTQFLEF